MNTSKRALTGSIHKIREFELEKVCLVEEFDILQIVGEGWFGKILLVEHRASDTEVVLKALPKPYVTVRDFYREFHYSLHLGAHRNIVTTFDVAFETAGFYVFCQEYAPLGDLTSNMLDTGIGEIHTKRVAKQLSAALEHIHQRDLVHRDVKLDNILIFKTDFSRIKLCDFGETRKVGSEVRRRNEWLPYSPPEVLSLAMDSSYKALVSHDVWQFGIVIFICLTGCLPWQKAAFDDPRYTSYFHWYSSANPLKRQPKLWKMVTSRAQKMFKKFVEPRKEKRAHNFQELARFLDDRWLAKGYTDRVAGGDIDELCPSMYSFHSDPNEKNILLRHFLENGIETTVDRQAKKQRIREWIQNSVIEEADEEEESNYEVSVFEDSEGELEDTGRTRNHPIDESHRVKLKFDTEKHINPRTGEIIEGANTKPQDKRLMSYDVQGIEPVAPANVVRNYGIRDDNSGNSSTKDSAYGSMEGRTEKTPIVKEPYNRSPSRSLSTSSIQPNKSPMTIHAQRIQKTDEVFSQEIQNMQGSSSTVNSFGNPARPHRTSTSANNHLEVPRQKSYDSRQNSNTELNEAEHIPIKNDPQKNPTQVVYPQTQDKQFNQSFNPEQQQQQQIYVSLKDSPYDTVSSRNDINSGLDNNNGNSNVPESPYVSMMNIVQGQIQINPYGNELNQNVVNVSVTPVKEKRYQRYSSYT